MPAPAVVFSETNTPSATVTDGITGIVFANTDMNSNTVNLGILSPVPAGSNSFEKYLRMKVTQAATNSLSAFSVYTAAGAILDGGGNAGNITIKSGVNLAYATPTNATSTVDTVAPATAAPGTAFGAPSNAVGSYSSYFGFQAQVASAAQEGQTTFPAAYFNVAYFWS